MTQGFRCVLGNDGMVTSQPAAFKSKGTAVATNLWSSVSNHQMRIWFDT